MEEALSSFYRFRVNDPLKSYQSTCSGARNSTISTPAHYFYLLISLLSLMPLCGLRSPHTDYYVNRGGNLKGSKERDMTKRYVYISAGDSQGLQNRNAPNTFVNSFLLHVKEEWPQREGRSKMGIKGKKICRKKE